MLHAQEQSANGRAMEVYCISGAQVQMAGDAASASDSGGLLGSSKGNRGRILAEQTADMCRVTNAAAKLRTEEA